MKFDARANEKSWMAEKDVLLRRLDKSKGGPKRNRVWRDIGRGPEAVNRSKDSGRSHHESSPDEEDSSPDHWDSSPCQSFSRRVSPGKKLQRKRREAKHISQEEQRMYGAEIKVIVATVR